MFIKHTRGHNFMMTEAFDREQCKRSGLWIWFNADSWSRPLDRNPICGWVSSPPPKLRVMSECDWVSDHTSHHHWPWFINSLSPGVGFRLKDGGDAEPTKQRSSSAKNTQQSGCGGVRGWDGGKISQMDEGMDPPVTDVLHNLQEVVSFFLFF